MCSLAHLTLPLQQTFDGQFLHLLRFGPLPLQGCSDTDPSHAQVRALTHTEDITPLGRLLSKLPTDVHLGKFLLIATTFRCLDPALTIAATLSSKSPFLVPFGSEDAADIAKSRFKVKSSDFLTIHNAFDGWRKTSANSLEFARSYCRKNFLSYQVSQLFNPAGRRP